MAVYTTRSTSSAAVTTHRMHIGARLPAPRPHRLATSLCVKGTDAYSLMSASFSPSCTSLPYPGYEEEHEVFSSAYSHAFDDAKPTCLQTEGLQEFAGSLWERRRHIPSLATCPLHHVFTEFDVDCDGRLTATEIAAALQSRGVKVTVPQIQKAIDAYEERTHSECITAQEWPDFVFALAAADLKKDHDLSVLVTGSQSSMDEDFPFY